MTYATIYAYTEKYSPAWNWPFSHILSHMMTVKPDWRVRKCGQGQVPTSGRCSACGSPFHLSFNRSRYPFNRLHMRSALRIGCAMRPNRERLLKKHRHYYPSFHSRLGWAWHPEEIPSVWLQGRLLTFRKEVLMRLLIEIEMATMDSIVQLATFSATVLWVQAYP